MIVIFDRQHYGKPGKSDFGASVDLDGDGIIENQEREANITPLYFIPAKEQLTRLGHSVYVLDSGWYPQRHTKANDIARLHPDQKVAYIACHVNAGGGDYAVVIHDSRSRNGAHLADALCASFAAKSLSGIRRILLRSATAENEWRRGFTTISGIYSGPSNISGVCLEPFFLDRQTHQWLATTQGGQAIADVLVQGLVRWGS